MCSPGGAFLIGDPATVAAKTLAASDMLGGIARITFQMSSALIDHEIMKRTIRLIGTEVAPFVRRGFVTPESAVASGAKSVAVGG